MTKLRTCLWYIKNMSVQGEESSGDNTRAVLPNWNLDKLHEQARIVGEDRINFWNMLVTFISQSGYNLLQTDRQRYWI